MTDVALPLFNLFTRLQRRNYPLGVSEYLLALEALSSDLRITTREDLIFMCQALWAKSPQEQLEVAQELNALLPKKLTIAELEAMTEAARRERAQLPPDSRTDRPASGVAAPPEATPASTSSTPTGQAEQQKQASQSASAQSNIQLEVAAQTGTGVATFTLEIEEKTWAADPRFDYIGSLPVTRRQMKRAWRYMRLIKRVGAPVELDVEATIAHTYRLGVFIEMILMPRRANFARLLILADEGGSMVPFRRVTEPLLESAQQSGLAKVAVFYFHDMIRDAVYPDALMTKPEPLERALNSSRWTGILIISDGGAARGNYDDRRILHTAQVMQKLKQATPNIAWLNPTPPSRWPGTSAGELPDRCGVPMFTLDRGGLDGAVDAVRGRAR